MSTTTAVPLWPWNEPQDFCRLIRKHDGSYWWAPISVEVPADFAVVVQADSAEFVRLIRRITNHEIDEMVKLTRGASRARRLALTAVISGLVVALIYCTWLLTGGV